MTLHHTTLPTTAWSQVGWWYWMKLSGESFDLESPEELLNRQEEE